MQPGGAAERGHPRDGHRADGGEAQDRGAAEGARQGACVVYGLQTVFFSCGRQTRRRGRGRSSTRCLRCVHDPLLCFFLFFRRRTPRRRRGRRSRPRPVAAPFAFELHQTLTCASMSSIFLQPCSCYPEMQLSLRRWPSEEHWWPAPALLFF